MTVLPQWLKRFSALKEIMHISLFVAWIPPIPSLQVLQAHQYGCRYYRWRDELTEGLWELMVEFPYKYCITIILIPSYCVYFTPLTVHLHCDSDQCEPPVCAQSARLPRSLTLPVVAEDHWDPKDTWDFSLFSRFTYCKVFKWNYLILLILPPDFYKLYFLLKSQIPPTAIFFFFF